MENFKNFVAVWHVLKPTTRKYKKEILQKNGPFLLHSVPGNLIAFWYFRSGSTFFYYRFSVDSSFEKTIQDRIVQVTICTKRDRKNEWFAGT